MEANSKENPKEPQDKSQEKEKTREPEDYEGTILIYFV